MHLAALDTSQVPIGPLKECGAPGARHKDAPNVGGRLFSNSLQSNGLRAMLWTVQETATR
jgi:hypothetical protein